MSSSVDFVFVFGAFLLLLFGGMWVQLAIGCSALLYIFLLNGFGGFNALGLVSWGSAKSFAMAAIPLFILMAEILLESGLSSRVYRGLSRVVHRLPGGLLQTNIASCAVFAAVSGGSAPTAAAIGTVALPELNKRNYDRKLSAGSLAAGGTLGILIPPSITMIVYGSITETSVAKLFMAGMVPGITLASFYMIYIAARALYNPSIAPRLTQPLTRAEKVETVFDLVPFTLLMVGVLGSIYLGIATPTEAAAVGSSLAIVISWIWADLSFSVFRKAVRKTVRITGGILFIVFVAMLFAYVTAIAGVGEALATWLAGLGLTKVQFLFTTFLLFAVLGCIMEGLGMMVLTVPLLYPVLLEFGIDPIWFGVIMVILIELGQLTPPVGVILFVINGVWEGGTLEEVILGTAQFYAIIFLLLTLLVFVPELALWLPSHMFAR